MAAVLDQARNSDLWMLLGCESNQPRVIAILLGHFILVLTSDQTALVSHDLGRAGLGAYRDSRQLRLVRRASRPIYHVRHRVADERQVIGVDIHPLLHDRRIRSGYAAIEAFHFLDELW